MTAPKIIVHTDVFLDHLTGRKHPSSLRMAMGKFFCYATVFQAIELFAMARSENERRAIEDSMAAMKILGLNPKNARRYGDLLARAQRSKGYALLVAGLCLDSRLPLLTGRVQEFRGIPGLHIVPTRAIAMYETAAEVLKATRNRKGK